MSRAGSGNAGEKDRQGRILAKSKKCKEEKKDQQKQKKRKEIEYKKLKAKRGTVKIQVFISD